MHIVSTLFGRFVSYLSLVALASIGFFVSGLMSAEAAGYHVASKQHLDGDIKWDYLIVDSKDRHLFIAHGDRVDVFDIDKKLVVGILENTHGVHGVALAEDMDRGFTSNGKDNSVTIFELSTLKILGSAPTQKKPDGILYDQASKTTFVANGASESLTPIDAVSGKAMTSLPLGGKPEFLAVDGKGRLFVNLEDRNELLVVDTKRLAITHRYDLSASCDEPAGLSIDPDSKRLFVGCHNEKMVIVEADSGRILDVLPIGHGCDATAYDVSKKLAFSSNGDGTLNVISALDINHYQKRQTVITLPGARTMAIDSVSHKIFLVAAEAESDEPDVQDSRQRLHYRPDTFTLITVEP